MVEHISMLRPGGKACELGRLPVVDVRDGIDIKKITNRRRRIPKLEPLLMNRRTGREGACVRDARRPNLVLAVLPGNSLWGFVHVADRPLRAGLQVAKPGN